MGTSPSRHRPPRRGRYQDWTMQGVRPHTFRTQVAREPRCAAELDLSPRLSERPVNAGLSRSSPAYSTSGGRLIRARYAGCATAGFDRSARRVRATDSPRRWRSEPCAGHGRPKSELRRSSMTGAGAAAARPRADVRPQRRHVPPRRRGPPAGVQRASRSDGDNRPIRLYLPSVQRENRPWPWSRS